ncbi:alpha/beta hydrolase [Streptomyces sp. NPDC052236]|uniref:alpha/beta hydrolase n=1 Tax=Streptomyces sp. NPDC052236 TaxID=3365686 RepID=UPI0037CE740E
MVSLQELKDLKLTEFVEASKGWADVSNRAYTSRKRVDHEVVAKLIDTQDGMAAMSAVYRLGRLSRNFHYIHTECGLLQASLSGLAQEMAAPQRRLLIALAQADHYKFTVHDDGSVSYPAAGEPIDGQQPQGNTATGSDSFFGSAIKGSVAMINPNPNPNAAKAQDIADDIASALTEAGEIDAEYAAAVRRLKAEQGLEVTESTWADVSGDAKAVHGAADDVLKDDIPTGGSPAERKAWWDGLTEEERIAYLAVYPDTVGNLDGIPAVARDEANRGYLPQLMGKLSEQGDEASQTKLAGLRGIQQQMISGPAEPPMFLLGIGDQGNGRAIVAYGNPDTSRNVSAYVPGLGTKLNGEFATGTMKRAFDTASGARDIDPSSASIVWLGYDAPQDVDVMSDSDAKRGAPAYNSFMSGLLATNDNADPHMTAIGHSYGSLTVGQATQQPGGIPGADDIILVGSPGVGVDRAEDLGVGKQHVFVGAADNDRVTKLPSKPEAGVILGGAGAGAVAGAPLGPVGVVGGAAVGGLLGWGASGAADPGGDDVYFGRDPASEAFGANRFRTEPGPEVVDVEFPNVWDSTVGAEAHSNYFNPEKDQISSDNIAAIVAGEPGKMIPEARR